ncbi:MAG: glycosyltransferase family 9 protein [Ignavibacteriaceae bacterium]
MVRQKRILIVRQDRIGDVVVSTSIPRAIKKQWTDSYVAVLVSSYTKDIYLNNPYVDDIIIYEDVPFKSINNFVKRVKEIRRNKFTHALMLLPSKRINYLLFLSGIRKRIGVGEKFYQFITFVKGVSRHKYIPLRHEADYCMDLARRIGIKSNDYAPKIYLSETEKNYVKETRFRLLGENKIIVGIHSSNGHSAPNLPVRTYLQLIKRLQNTNRFKIVVTDNIVPPEMQNLEGVEYPNDGSDLRNSILNFAALDILISSSTGPMHIAAALGIKTLSMFCPLPACSPKLWGPLGNDNTIILPEENYCNINCKNHPKDCTFEGNGGISIGKILFALNSVAEEYKKSA